MNFPDRLTSLLRWICWRYLSRTGNPKPTKVPVDPATGRPIDATNLANGCSLQEAQAGCQRDPDLRLGFLLGDGIEGIDLDHCLTGSELTSEAQTILEMMSSYSEVSPSGTGIHILFETDGPATNPPPNRNGAFEYYPGKRFFCMTGQFIRGHECLRKADAERDAVLKRRREELRHERQPENRPSCAEKPMAAISDEVLLLRISEHPDWGDAFSGEPARRLAAKAKALERYAGDESRADMALAGALARHTADGDQIEKIMRQSALMRPKWDHHPTYLRERTIEKVLEVPDPGEDAPAHGKASVATKLVKLCDDLSLIHTPEGECYAQIPMDGFKELLPLGGGAFRSWLARRGHKVFGLAAGSAALSDAITVMSGRALYDGPERRVFRRVAGHDGKTYLFMADPRWRSIEIGPDGWRIVDEAPVLFTKSSTSAALPEPNTDFGTEGMERLWALMNLAPEDRPGIRGWLINTLHPDGPYIGLNITGEQGTAKSTTARILRDLVDPQTSNLVSRPRKEDDLYVNAADGHIFALDNLSFLEDWMSDGLCRISTGVTHKKRRLYSDADTIGIWVKRPFILNGISNVAARPDLASRCLQVELQPIPATLRRTESELRSEFANAHPFILGALLKHAVAGLRNPDAAKGKELPRMADAAAWIIACETADRDSGPGFLGFLNANQRESSQVSIEGSTFASHLKAFIDQKAEWRGNCQALLKELNDGEATERIFGLPRDSHWPGSPRAASDQIRRFTPCFREMGYLIQFVKSGNTRWVLLRRPAP